MIRLKKGKEAIFHNRHQWIFSGAIESFPHPFEEGAIYPIQSHSGEHLGYGYFHRSQSLSGRILSFGKEDPWKAVYRHLDEAIELRDKIFDHKTNGYRLVNGEGDHVPGLIIDQYGDFLVLQSGSLGMDKMIPQIVDYLAKKKRWKGIFEKSVSSSRKEERLGDVVRVLFGEEQEEIEILENGLRFLINWKKGQKTGFFLDQREMRSLVGQLAKGKRVLNCFCYTGGFSVYALAGGAREVGSVDISASALEMAKRIFEANHLRESRLIAEDVFEFLRKDPLAYELIILDPPAFIKKKKDLKQGIKGYREINATAIAKMPKGALLLTCSCSYYMDDALFRTVLFQAAQAAKRDIQILKEGSHPLDHPVSLFHPESRYLKGLLLRVL